MVSQDRRHLFVTPCYFPFAVLNILSFSQSKSPLLHIFNSDTCDTAHCKEPIPKIGNTYSQKRIARPQSQFPHSCVCERFIYSQDLSAYSAAVNTVCGPILGIYKSLTNTEIGIRVHAIPRKEINKWDLRCSAVTFDVYMKPNKYLLEGGPRWQWHHGSEFSHAMWRGARVWERTPEYLHPSLLSGPLNHPNLLKNFFNINA